MHSTASTIPPDEQLLLIEFREGNDLAMKRIFQMHWKTQVFFARRFVAEKEIAEEIVSNVFLKLWGLREGFASLPSIRSFLYVSVRNACVDHIRKEKRVRKYAKDYAYVENAQLDDSELDEVIRAELVSKVLEAINGLPNQYRKVMQLSSQGLGTEEIAEAMSLSPKIVRNYRARAINILKKDLLDKSHLIFLMAILAEKIPW
jgi:RNA polymerase sigma-70 factor (family 1)